MAIEVLIKRATKPGGNAKILLPQIVELRAHAIKQPGYISGETLFNLDRLEECLVISRWVKLEYWQQWIRNPIRVELNEKLEQLQETKSVYDIYGVGLW